MTYRLGIDTGGTFVDLVLIDDRGGLHLSKSPSDPRDLAGAVLTGLEQAASDRGMTLTELLSRTDRIVHGTTVATNALLTRRGAVVALLTTRGFRDVLQMRRGVREHPLDSRYAPPPPLVPRERIFEVDERLDSEGRELTPLNEQEVEELVLALRDGGVQGVAVSFMFSFLDSGNELQVRRLIEKQFPDLHVSLSSEVLPQLGLYERVSTTVVNAFVSPLLSAYLDTLVNRLEDSGFEGSLLLMQSNGGVCAPEIGERFGVVAVFSGPAAAPVTAAQISAFHGLENVISVDMGGTSFDVCLINGGKPHVTAEGELAGYRIAVPMVDSYTIGAGGGSIVGVDSRGLMSVGPNSAGAYPGPVCYDRGGTQPTVTDANLILGYLDPHTFWGGRLNLDASSAERAFHEQVAEPLGLDTTEAAFGAYRVVNESMVDAIREVSVRRGYDARRYALVAAGGAGPLHGAALAAELKIPLVIVPRLASVFCALGGLLSDLRHEFATSFVADLDTLDAQAAEAVLDHLIGQGQSTLAAEGVVEADMALDAFVALRYVGQFTEVKVPLPTSRFTKENLEAAIAEFHARHEAVNGWHDPSNPLEIVNIGVVATGKTEKPAIPTLARSGNHAAPSGIRKIYWEDGIRSVPVYRGIDLEPGSLVSGPALVEQETTTLIVPPEFVLTTDEYGNGLMYGEGEDLEEILVTLREDS